MYVRMFVCVCVYFIGLNSRDKTQSALTTIIVCMCVFLSVCMYVYTVYNVQRLLSTGHIDTCLPAKNENNTQCNNTSRSSRQLPQQQDGVSNRLTTRSTASYTVHFVQRTAVVIVTKHTFPYCFIFFAFICSCLFSRHRHNPLTSLNCRQTKTVNLLRSEGKKRIDTSFVKPRTAYFFSTINYNTQHAT